MRDIILLAIVYAFLNDLVEVAFVSGSSRVNEDVGIATIPVMVSSLSTQGLTFSAVSSGNSATGAAKLLIIVYC